MAKINASIAFKALHLAFLTSAKSQTVKWQAMHVSRLHAKPVKQPNLAPGADMSAVWHLAARLRLCHVPARLRQATASTEPITRSLKGICITPGCCKSFVLDHKAARTRWRRCAPSISESGRSAPSLSLLSHSHRSQTWHNILHALSDFSASPLLQTYYYACRRTASAEGS